MEKTFFVIGTLFSGLAVAAGAFGAHGLKNIVSAERLITWEKAVRYQMYHGLALMLIAWAITQWWNQTNTLQAGGWFFIIGTLLFSGSLYYLVFNGSLDLNGISLGLVTPVGGVFFVLGWLALMIAAWRG
ncbi:MAG: DUF423 domain-containing protein [Anaerolineae bacterium]|nr:DUF423 domain-containing protein [Anaerolineae bacterium]MBL6965035.1 DUF423 domain-containing protein [Anaerolineales bacterium]